MSSTQGGSNTPATRVLEQDEDALSAEQALSLYPQAGISNYLHDAFRANFDLSESPAELSVDEIRNIESKDISVPDLVEDLHLDPEEMMVSMIDAAGSEVNLVGEANTHTSLESIRTDLIGSLVSAEVRVTDVSKQFPIHTVAVLECLKCGTYNEQVLDINNQHEVGDVNQCEGCEAHPKHLETDLQKTVSADAQQSIVQDLHTSTDSSNPTDISVNFYGSLVNEVHPGETITITGIVRVRDEGESYEYYIDATGVQHHDEDYSGVDITDEDEERIRSISESDHVISRLKSSIAPQIEGDYDLARTALLLQQFEGVDQPHEDSNPHIHVALVGDPGVGKSKLARYSERIAPNGVYKSAESVTAVGLTAAVTREERFNSSEWTLHGGALVEADGGLAVIDELDKASSEVQNSLHAPLSDQVVEVSKSSISADLPTRCSATFVANPVNQRFDAHQKLAEQIPIESALWDRFDVIIPFVDTPDEDRDSRIVSSIFDRAKGDTKDVISPEMMRKYIALGRRMEPTMTDSASDVLEQAWSSMREESSKTKISIGYRQAESLRKLTEASARARLDDEVKIKDAERAVDLMQGWMDAIARDSQGDYNIDSVSSEMDYSERERINVVYRLIQELSEDDEGGVERDELVSEMIGKGIDANTAQQTINAEIGRKNISQEDSRLINNR